jgi:hypothetical protein
LDKAVLAIFISIKFNYPSLGVKKASFLMKKGKGRPSKAKKALVTE